MAIFATPAPMTLPTIALEITAALAGPPVVFPDTVTLTTRTHDTLYFYPDGTSTVSKFSVSQEEKTASFSLKGFVHGIHIQYN